MENFFCLFVDYKCLENYKLPKVFALGGGGGCMREVHNIIRPHVGSSEEITVYASPIPQMNF